MITLRLTNGSTFEFSTPSEAATFYRLTQGQGSTGASVATLPSIMATGHATQTAAPTLFNPDVGIINGARMVDSSDEFLRKLLPLRGQRLSAENLVSLLGAANANGVGPRLAAIRKALEARNPPIFLNDYLVPSKNADGTMAWTVSVPNDLAVGQPPQGTAK